MTDVSIDATIIEMADKLFQHGWSVNEESYDLLIQRCSYPNTQGDPKITYMIYIVYGLGSLGNFPNCQDWRVKHVLCSSSGDTIVEAKQNLLDDLMNRARDALAVPVEQVMDS